MILLSIFRKILAIIVVSRTFDRLREVISISQAAYSPGRSTTELVFAFKVLIEKSLCSQDYPIHILMLDMSRAFDTIDRGTLLTDLSEILEPDELHLVSLLLTDVQIQVKHDNLLGKIFKPDIGSPQGDCASPIWFIYYLHKALELAKPKFENPRNINLDIEIDHPYCKRIKSEIEIDHSYCKQPKLDSKSKKGQGKFCFEQQYADDTSWVTNVESTKISIKEIAAKELKDKNLIVNEDKTEDYCIKRNGNENWKKCKFLGSLLGNSEDIARRKQLACAAFSKYKTILCTKHRPLTSRIRSFMCFVAPVFLYNCELWSLSTANIKKIDSFQRDFLRQIVRTKYITNKRLYTVWEIDTWSVIIQSRRLAWFGQLIRLPEEASPKKAYWEAKSTFSKKVHGGQPTTWLFNIIKDFKLVDTSIDEAQKIAPDKEKFKELLGSAMSHVRRKLKYNKEPEQ